MEHNKQEIEKDASLAKQQIEISKDISRWMNENSNAERTSSSTVIIPVVIHVLWHDSIENISDAAILSQLDVLNQDYSRTNSDASLTPSLWQSIAVNTDFKFCFAKRKPDGTHTNGIERKQTTVVAWSPDDAMKHAASDGLDVWDRNQYLNIWVVNFSNNVLGYSELPGSPADIDGVAIAYEAFGKYETYLSPQYNLGRTTTHEIGHWFGLLHTWGDDGGNCNNSDSVADTPNQGLEDYGCPTFPKTDACSPSSPGIMFMNYMDYSDDVCMNMFTAGQVARMTATLNAYRPSIITSPGCASVGIDEIDLYEFITVFPNPAAEEVFLSVNFPQFTDLKYSVNNLLCETVISGEEKNVSSSRIKINVSALATGMYVLLLRTDEGVLSKKINVFR
jgi:hypothetical protein